jgi:hypothetical protein
MSAVRGSLVANMNERSSPKTRWSRLRLKRNPKPDAMSSEQIAKWMLEELERVEFLYQETVVFDIASKFGDEFTVINDNGNMAIRRDILSAFRALTGDSVIWERGERMWRKRQAHDEVGRQQD